MRFRDYLFVFVAFAIPALCLGDEPPSVSAVSFNVYEFMESSPDLEPEAPPAVALIAVNAVSNCRCTDCPKGGNCEDCDCPTFAVKQPVKQPTKVESKPAPTVRYSQPTYTIQRRGVVYERVCGQNGCYYRPRR